MAGNVSLVFKCANIILFMSCYDVPAVNKGLQTRIISFLFVMLAVSFCLYLIWIWRVKPRCFPSPPCLCFVKYVVPAQVTVEALGGFWVQMERCGCGWWERPRETSLLRILWRSWWRREPGSRPSKRRKNSGETTVGMGHGEGQGDDGNRWRLTG